MKRRHWNGAFGPRLGINSSLLSFAIVCATTSIIGCASDTGSDSGEVGSLGLNLTVAPGVTIDEVSYAIEGNGFTKDGLVGVPDVFATVLDFAGAESEAPDSYSIKPVLSDESAHSGRVHSYTEIGVNAQHKFAIKDTRYKLAYPGNGSWELYDLVADPLETTNLYSSAPHAAALASLQAELAELEADASDAYFP